MPNENIKEVDDATLVELVKNDINLLNARLSELSKRNVFMQITLTKVTGLAFTDQLSLHLDGAWKQLLAQLIVRP